MALVVYVFSCTLNLLVLITKQISIVLAVVDSVDLSECSDILSSLDNANNFLAFASFVIPFPDQMKPEAPYC